MGDTDSSDQGRGVAVWAGGNVAVTGLFRQSIEGVNSQHALDTDGFLIAYAG